MRTHTPRNLAARAGRWSARHRKTAILGWIAFVVVAFMIGGKVGTDKLDPELSGVGDSGRASRITAEAYPERVDESVLIQSKTLEAGDPGYRAVVEDVTDRLERTDGVLEVHGPYDKHDAAP